MNLPDKVQELLEQYLEDVDRQLVGRSGAARRELLRELREHLHESLQRRGGDHPSVEDAEAAIAEMDSPESFASPEPSSSGPDIAPPHPASSRWFLLALCFLLLNGWAVWTLVHRQPATVVAIPSESTNLPPKEALALLRVDQVNLSPDREGTFQLVFNSPPDLLELKKHLHLSTEDRRALDWELVGAARSEPVLIRTGPIAEDTFQLALDVGLPARGDSAPLAQAVSLRVPVIAQFSLSRIYAECSSFAGADLYCSFSETPDLATAESTITITPGVTWTVRPSYSGLDINGDFKPGGIYTVTFRPGLKSVNANALGREVVRQVQMPRRPPAVALPLEGRYLSPQGRLALPVSAVNVRQCVVRISPVLPQNLVYIALHEEGLVGNWYDRVTATAERLAGPGTTLTNRLPEALNEENRFFVNLRDLAGPEPRGLYVLTVAGDSGSPQSALVAVTDLGIAAKRGRDAVLVWVNTLSGAQPVANAEVVLYAQNNREMARTSTDSNGVARLPFESSGDGDTPFLVTVRSGSDLSFLALAGPVDVPGDAAGRPYLVEGFEAFVFTDRGIYRPGETIHLKALVRDSRLEPPPAFPALFRVLKPDGRVFKTIPVQLDDAGAAETAVAMPEYLPTGRYELQLVLPGTLSELGSTAVAMEEFVPPQIRVRLEDVPESARSGESLEFGVRADHLFGRPAAGLRASASATIRAADFTSARWEGWQFGDHEKEFSEMFRRLDEATLDAEGQAGFDLETSEAWRPPSALEVVVEGTVLEANGRSVSARATTRIDPYPFYIGLRAAGGVVTVGATQRVGVVEVTPDGLVATNAKPLVVRLDRAEWSTVLRRNSSGRYTWESAEQKTKILEDTFAATGRPAEYACSVASSGEYLLTFTDPASGASSSLRFYAGSREDQDWNSWSRETPDAVELTFDQSHYRPGDTAHLVVRAPFTGPALLTIESDRILEHRVIELAKNTAQIDIPVRPEFVPNVYCAVTVIRPAQAESVWTAHRAAGIVPLSVVPPARKLSVGIVAPATNRPLAQMTADLTVRDESGAPAAADVTVFAVDQAICMLTDFETPDPLAWFLEQRAAEVELYDLYSVLVPIVDDATLAGASHPPGGEADQLTRRLNPIKANRFRPVALWGGTVRSDTNGNASVRFALPEFAGELRLMAVAWNRAQMGMGQQSVKVKRPVVVQPSLPRFMAPADECPATVELYNESGSEAVVQLRVTCGGPLTVDEPERSLTLAAGEGRTVTLPLRAGAVPGKGLVSFEITACGESYRDTVEVPIRPTSTLTVRSGFGVVKPGATATLTPPQDWIRDSLRADVWCSGRPTVKLQRALDYLLQYPYGCLEQTVSGAFPLLYLSDLAAQSATQTIGREETEGFVRSAVLRVLSMQQYDGSFAMWPNTSQSAGWCGIYAVHFLLEARRAAYDVPPDRLESALTALRARLDRDTCDIGSADWASDMTERAYACQVLALAGRPEHGWNARLREEAARLPYAARIHAAAALLASGEPRQATELMRSLDMPDMNRPREAGRIASGGAREAALLLGVWLDVDPRNPIAARLAQALEAREKDGHWETTQDDALALMALGKYARLAPPPQSLSATLRTPDGLSQACSATQSLHWVACSNRVGEVTIHNDGPGELYYSFRTEGVPSTNAMIESDDGLQIRRTWCDLDGKPRDMSRPLAQGDLIVVHIALDTQDRELDNLIVEDLLPAGLEIENPNLATAQLVPWIKEKSDWCIYRDQRDDRLLLFSGTVRGTRHFYYAARAVTPGRFIQPAVTACCMYDPAVRSAHGAGIVEVTP